MKTVKVILISSSMIILMTTLTNAQSWQWAKKFGGSLDDKTYTLTSDMDGSVYVAGFYNSTTITFDTITLTNSGYDIFLVKFDYNGNVQWAKSSIGAGLKEVKCVCTDDSGNIIITGYFRDSLITFGNITLHNNGTYDLFVVKYDPNGSVLWAKNSEYSGAYTYGASVTSDFSGNIIAVGYFRGIKHAFGTDTLINNCVSGGTYDMYIIQYDANGNQLWARRDGGSQDDYPTSVVVDRNSNEIFMTGQFISPQIYWSMVPFIHIYNAVTSSPYKSDMFLVKYDSTGTVLWAKSQGGTSWDIGRDISIDDQGNIFVSGNFESDSVIFGTYQLNIDIAPDLFLVKYNSTGDVQWAKKGTGANIDWGLSVLNDASGNVYMSGQFTSPTLTLDNLVLNNSGTGSSSDIFVSKFDNTGNIQWAKTTSGQSSKQCYSMTMDNFGAIYVAGFYSGTTISFDTITISQSTTNYMNIFLAKLDTNYVTACNPIQINEKLIIYPNPFNESAIIKFYNPDNKEFILTMTDTEGRIVRRITNVTDNEIPLNKEGLSNGLYFIEIKTESKTVRGKIIIE